jgi:hypothetical protein
MRTSHVVAGRRMHISSSDEKTNIFAVTANQELQH